MAPVNQVTTEGLPVLFIKDLPPVSTISIKLTRPQIYYGELTNEYVFVGTKQKEFDYPAGETNIYTNYTGLGGVPIGSLLRRVLYAFQLGSLKILLSDDIRGNAKILYRRNVMDRATTAMPFLDFDKDPYLTINDAGQLKWILDAYTTKRHVSLLAAHQRWHQLHAQQRQGRDRCVRRNRRRLHRGSERPGGADVRAHLRPDLQATC